MHGISRANATWIQVTGRELSPTFHPKSSLSYETSNQSSPSKQPSTLSYFLKKFCESSPVCCARAFNLAHAVCCSMVQHGEACCSVLQPVAAYCSVLQFHFSAATTCECELVPFRDRGGAIICSSVHQKSPVFIPEEPCLQSKELDLPVFLSNEHDISTQKALCFNVSVS